jgi:hypothetical protein
MLATTAVAKTLTPRLCSRWAPNQITGSCEQERRYLEARLVRSPGPKQLTIKLARIIRSTDVAKVCVGARNKRSGGAFRFKSKLTLTVGENLPT